MIYHYPLKTPEAIKQWLNEKNIIYFTIHDDLTVDVDTSVILLKESLSELPFKFGKINGDFNISFNKLKNLIGSPNHVVGHFFCSENNLTSLEGVPQIIEGAFHAKKNHLTALDFFPLKVGTDILLSHNKLTNLIGLNHSKVNGIFDASYNRLTSLEGAPKWVANDCKVSNNYLTSLAFAPEEVRSLVLDNNYLVNLIGCSPIIHDSLYCQLNHLKSLEGIPKIIHENLIVSDNELTTLEYAPEIIKGNLECSNNPLTTLKHAPKEVDKLLFNYTLVKHYDNPNVVLTGIEHAYFEGEGEALKGLEQFYIQHTTYNQKNEYLLDLSAQLLLTHIEKHNFEKSINSIHQKPKSIKL